MSNSQDLSRKHNYGASVRISERNNLSETLGLNYVWYLPQVTQIEQGPREMACVRVCLCLIFLSNVFISIVIHQQKIQLLQDDSMNSVSESLCGCEVFRAVSRLMKYSATSTVQLLDFQHRWHMDDCYELFNSIMFPIIFYSKCF